MTDLQTPAVPVEPATPQTPEPIQPEAGQEQDKPQDTPKYVTEEQLNSMKADIVRDITKRDKQRAQQIKQDLQAEISRLEKVGLQLSPEQQVKLESEIIAGYQDDDEPAPQPVSDAPPEVVPAINWMKRQGIIVTSDDPEYKQFLDPVFNVPQLDQVEISLAMAKAVEAKRARTLQSKDMAPLRTPAGGGSQGPVKVTAKSAADYRKALARERGG